MDQQAGMQLVEDMKSQVLSDMLMMIKECNGSESSISQISRFCITKSAKSQVSEVDVSKVFESIITSENQMIELKMIALQIMTQILIDNTCKSYFRHFSSRILLLITKYKHEIAGEPTAVRTLKNILSKWKSNKVFSEAFYSKILSLAGATLIEKIDNEVQAFEFIRYSKKSLMGIRDVNRVTATSMLYKTICQSRKFTSSVEQIVSQEREVSSLFDTNLRNIQADSLLKLSDQLIEQHKKTLMELNEGIKNLGFLFEDEAKSLHLTANELQTQDI